MSCGYDPFYWLDIELERNEEEMKKVEIDLDAITQRMDELKDAKARYTFELKQIEKEIETLELKLIALLDQTGTETMDYGVYSFGWKTTERTAFDPKLFGEKYPDLLNEFRITKENRTFQFKINKKMERNREQ